MLNPIDPQILKTMLSRWIAVGMNLEEQHLNTEDIGPVGLAIQAIEDDASPPDRMLPGYVSIAFDGGFNLACKLFVAMSADPLRVDRRAVCEAIESAREWLQSDLAREREEGRDPLAYEHGELEAVVARSAKRASSRRSRPGTAAA
jgi:hypothetical protein